MKCQTIFYPESDFGGFTDVDGTIAFYTRINSLLNSSLSVLDVGCGRGSQADDLVPIRRNLRVFKGKVARVVGIDVDKSAKLNPFLDEFYHISGDSWPIESSSIDLIVGDHVLEHVEEPDRFFSEARRVLRPAGYLCLRTSNKWSYVGILSRIIPTRYHMRVIARVQDGRKMQEVFPLVHNCNSIRLIKRMMVKRGFNCVVYGHESEPRYLEFSKTAYWMGVMHQRWAPRLLKPTIFAFGRKVKGFT